MAQWKLSQNWELLTKMTLNLWLELAKARSSVEFLRSFLEFGRPNKKFSYSQFSKKAGYSSKSFISEILSGKKKLTLDSAEKFSKGMSLNKDLGLYFKNLVAIELIERGQLKTHNKNSLILENEKIRSKLSSKVQLKPTSDDLQEKIRKTLLKNHFPTVFAALGSQDLGASVAEITQRTHLTTMDIKGILLDMASIGVVYLKGDRYFAKNNLVDLDFLKSNQYFVENFLRCSSRAQHRLRKNTNNTSSLFMTQTFSVHSSRLPELKERLKAVIIEFADDAENSLGDCVSEICVSFTSSK